MLHGKLFFVLSAKDEREFVLEKQTITLGRAADNDIFLPSPMVSRYHARLTFTPDPLLEDLGSSLGTTIGGEKISAPRPLQSGDIFSLADIRLRFEAPRPEETALRTIVDVANPGKPRLERAAIKATMTHTLLDVSPAVAAEASRQDATLQVVIAESGPRLVVREANLSRDVPLGKDPLVIGRAATCQLLLSSMGISHRHAEIWPQGDRYVVQDLGSTNGTLVNGEPITAPYFLADGDLISVGEAVVVYKSGKHQSLSFPGVQRSGSGARRPVVIVPGLMGSELRRGKLEIWPNYPYILSHPNILQPSSGPVDVVGMISEVVVVPHLIKLDGYSRLTQYLETNVGYMAGVDLLEFPYDWRQDNRLTAELLAARIVAWRQRMGHGPVTIIAHSMGGLVSRYYLDHLGGDEHVERLIVMGTPNLGIARGAITMLSGAGASPFNVARDKTRDIALNGPAYYELLPRYPCVVDTRGNEVDLFDDDSWLTAEHRHFLAGAAEFWDALNPQVTVSTLCIFGYGRPTPCRCVVERQDGALKLRSYDIEPVGDGGVAEQSAILEGADIHPVRQNHGALFTDPDVQRRLRLELMRH